MHIGRTLCLYRADEHRVLELLKNLALGRIFQQMQVLRNSPQGSSAEEKTLDVLESEVVNIQMLKETKAGQELSALAKMTGLTELALAGVEIKSVDGCMEKERITACVNDQPNLADFSLYDGDTFMDKRRNYLDAMHKRLDDMVSLQGTMTHPD